MSQPSNEKPLKAVHTMSKSGASDIFVDLNNDSYIKWNVTLSIKV